MNFLLAAPLLVKVLGTLALILLLNRLLKNLTAAVGAGTLILGLWVGHPLAEIAVVAWKRTLSADNLMLLAAITMVNYLGDLMSRTGVMEDLVTVVQARIPRRLSLAALPAVIGFLPMPGGALFSAPLVASWDRNDELSALLKARTNFWFRHVWECWWPLYPAVLLALSLTGLEVWQFICAGLPISALAIAAGYFFLLRRLPGETSGGSPVALPEAGFLTLVSPIAVVIAVYALIRLLLPGLNAAGKYLPMLIGLALALLLLQLQRRSSDWGKILFSRRTLKLALLVAFIRVYGALIEAPLPGGLLLVEGLRRELSVAGIPVTVVMMLVPFISGLSMGLSVGAVGASFPIVLSLLGPEPGTGALLAAAVLAYGSGYVGQMLSPVHVCLVVTNAYFKTRMAQSLLALLAPTAVVLAGIVLVSRVILAVWG
jgi:integral membrane protein (TIGR00529 family)